MKRPRTFVALSLVSVAFLADTPAAAQPTTSVGTTVRVVGGSYTNIGPTTLKAMLAKKNFLFVNVRVPYEGEIGQTDANIPYDQVAQRIRELPADRNARVVLYCRGGNMSATAAETRVRLGYTDVWNLEGGFEAWERAGFPLSKR